MAQRPSPLGVIFHWRNTVAFANSRSRGWIGWSRGRGDGLTGHSPMSMPRCHSIGRPARPLRLSRGGFKNRMDELPAACSSRGTSFSLFLGASNRCNERQPDDSKPAGISRRRGDRRLDLVGCRQPAEGWRGEWSHCDSRGDACRGRRGAGPATLRHLPPLP